MSTAFTRNASVWRIVKARYAEREHLLSGAGAADIGGKWNRPGIPVVYTSASSSLAILETLVHMTVEQAPASLVAVEIGLPEQAFNSMAVVVESSLPQTWRDPECEECVTMGSDWAERNDSFLLNVPSAVNPLERNILLNPAHPLIKQCRIKNTLPFRYDPRLIALFHAYEIERITPSSLT